MIRFERLCAKYDGVERLHQVSHVVPEGRLTALIGPNGSGKSTLMKCAAGILKPSDGEIFLGSHSMGEIGLRDLARQVSYMPQQRLAPSITVRQLVSHGRYPHRSWGRNLTGADREIIEAAMERTDTLSFAERPVSALSGGERQRAYLAMMLAQQTPVMLLDEPTTYLDLGSQFDLMALLRSLCAEGRTVIAVLHDLSLAMEYADELLLLQGGCAVCSGSPEEIYESGKLAEVFGVNVDCTERGRYIFSGKSGD